MRRLSSLSSLSKGKLNFVNGARVDGKGSSFEVFQPSNGKLLCQVPSTTDSDLENAIKVSRKAQLFWAQESPMERNDVLHQAGVLLDKYREEIAYVEAVDNGKPIMEARWDIQSAIDAFKYCGGTAVALLTGETQRGSGWKGTSFRVPHGLCAGIGAWNYPIQIAAFKTAPALACGNSVIFKPSEFCPLSAVLLGEVLREAGLPDGLYQVLQGQGELGNMVTTNRQVNKISFTGSVPTGVAILEGSAKHVRPVTLELGGKSPLVVFDDFDVDNAVQGIMQANFYSQGQVCSNGTRVYVHEDIYDSVKTKLVDQVDRIKIGDPLNDSTRMGALVSADHLAKVKGFVTRAQAEGGKVLTNQSPIINVEASGYFMRPIVMECHDSMELTREEHFGPICQLYKFSSEEEVLRRANNSNLGLAAGVFTNDFHRVDRFLQELQAGTLYVNCYNLAPAELGFGGFKQSGMGKENGVEFINQFTQLKTTFYPDESSRNLEF